MGAKHSSGSIGDPVTLPLGSRPDLGHTPTSDDRCPGTARPTGYATPQLLRLAPPVTSCPTGYALLLRLRPAPPVTPHPSGYAPPYQLRPAQMADLQVAGCEGFGVAWTRVGRFTQRGGVPPVHRPAVLPVHHWTGGRPPSTRRDRARRSRFDSHCVTVTVTVWKL